MSFLPPPGHLSALYDYDDSGRYYWSRDPWRGGPQWGSRWDHGQRWRDERDWGGPQRADPSYFWGGGRRYY